MAKHHPSLFFPGALYSTSGLWCSHRARSRLEGLWCSPALCWCSSTSSAPEKMAGLSLETKDGDHWEKSEKSPWFFKPEKWCYHQNGMILGHDFDSSWIFPSVFFGICTDNCTSSHAMGSPSPWWPAFRVPCSKPTNKYQQI
jgi:hypothetical protein